MKRILRDKANFVVLEGLISALLEKKVKISHLLESESNMEDEADKQNRVDLAAEDEDGHKIIVEVQNSRETAYFQRILFGTSRTISEYMKRGDGYDNVQKVYSINIVFFDLGQGDDFIYHGTTEFVGVHTGTKLKLAPFQQEKFATDNPSDLFPEYFILKVNGFNKVAKTPIEEWFRFFKDEKIADDTTVPGLAEAREIMRYDLMSEEEKRAYNRHLDNIAVLRDNIETARGEGRAEGLAEGRKEEKTDIVRKLLDMGYDDETIKAITGVTDADLMALKN